MEEESSFVLHVVICEKDDSVRKTLFGYIIAFSKELGFHRLLRIEGGENPCHLEKLLPMEKI